MKLAHLNSLNLRELLGRVTTKVLPVGAQSPQAAGGGRDSGSRQLSPLICPGLKYQRSSFYRQGMCHHLMARVNLQLTKVNSVSLAVEPRIYNATSGLHVWHVGKLLSSSLISPSNSSSIYLPRFFKKAEVVMFFNAALLFLLSYFHHS